MLRKLSGSQRERQLEGGGELGVRQGEVVYHTIFKKYVSVLSPSVHFWHLVMSFVVLFHSTLTLRDFEKLYLKCHHLNKVYSTWPVSWQQNHWLSSM